MVEVVKIPTSRRNPMLLEVTSVTSAEPHSETGKFGTPLECDSQSAVRHTCVREAGSGASGT